MTTAAHVNGRTRPPCQQPSLAKPPFEYSKVGLGQAYVLAFDSNWCPALERFIYNVTSELPEGLCLVLNFLTEQPGGNGQLFLAVHALQFTRRSAHPAVYTFGSDLYSRAEGSEVEEISPMYTQGMTVFVFKQWIQRQSGGYTKEAIQFKRAWVVLVACFGEKQGAIV